MGNIALEDDIVSEATRTNEVIVGVAGSKQGDRNGRPASRIFRSISSICSQQAIKLLRVSYGPGHAAPYGDAGAAGQRVTAADFAAWRFEAASSGNIHDTGSVRSAIADRNLPDGARAA